MYHISDLKKFIRCERLYYLGRDNNNVFKPFLRSDDNITDLLISYFDIDEYFKGEKNDTMDRFFENIDNYDWFVHPRFNDGEFRINIPLMHKVDNGFDLYFIYYGTLIKEIDILTYRVSYDLLKKNGIEVNNIYLIHFNGEYVNDGKLDVKKLFVVSEKAKDEKIINLVKKSDIDYENITKQMDEFNIDEFSPVVNKYCRQFGLCEHYKDCFPEREDIPDDSILTLVSSNAKNKMYDQGIKYLRDADIDKIEGSRVQYAQIRASQNGGVYVDKNALRNWLYKLSDRPISFIDFEWDRYLVPAYKDMKPLDVLCFEFALYYLDENNQLQHRTFISTGDCRKEFVEALIDYLPEKGPILAYNAYGAECLRLKELAEIYPEYKDKLENIIDRFFDLAVPFSEGIVYDTRMRGDFSLKRLVDICSDYSYKDLDIDDGMIAVFNWRDLDKNLSDDHEKIIEDLKQYCSLDAYGLFLIYKWLVELAI